MNRASKKDLQNIEVEITEKGFVVWVKETKKINGKMVTCKHWILDGGLVQEDGIIHLGNPKIWKINAKVDQHDNQIIVTTSKK